MSAGEMQRPARECGHECAFAVAAAGVGAAFGLRFFVPSQEMEMCGHATVGTLWLLSQLGLRGPGALAIETASGLVTGRIGPAGEVEVDQPPGGAVRLGKAAAAGVLETLGLAAGDLLAEPVTAWTSHRKTLVPLREAECLNDLTPDFTRMHAACELAGSTGLYPFAPVHGEAGVFEARQFPASSGYLEDPATGVAATALAAGLPATGPAVMPEAITVIQGRAMGHASEMGVRRARPAEGTGWWLGGEVRFLKDHARAAR
jgi:PhzF family phenazine biosynthesis protein